MTFRTAVRRITPGLAALALPASTALAQDTPLGQRPYRYTVQGYVSQGRFDGAAVPGSASSLGGYGVRVMFNRSTPAAIIRNFVDRATVGAFTTYTGRQGELAANTLHYGVQTDVSLLPAPLARGGLDPFVSLGAGVLRTGYGQPGLAGRAVDNDLAVTPAVGTRVHLLQRVGLRGDLRAPVVFGTRTTINPVAEAGLYVSF